MSETLYYYKTKHISFRLVRMKKTR